MWFYNIDSKQLLWVLAIAMPAHVLLAVLSRRYHPLYLLAAIFTIISPLSIAKDAAAFILMLKWARVYCIALIVVIGLFMLMNRRISFGKGSIVFLAAFTFYVIGGVWSDYPILAIGYKGNAFMLALAGVLLGCTVKGMEELRRGLRVLLFGTAVWTAIAAVGVAMGATSPDGRLSAYGMNPNGIAMISALSSIVALTVAIYDRNWILKAIGYGCVVVLSITVVMTGSRAGFGTWAIGSATVVAPLMRRPIVFLAFIFVIAITGLLVSDMLMQSEAAERLLETHNTRQGVWGYALEQAAEAPLLGQGWLSKQSFSARIWFHTHNIYLQVLVDVGLIGVIFFILSLIVACWRWLNVWRHASLFDKADRWPVYLGMGMFAATLGLGMFESAPISNASPAALYLAFSIGLADRLRTLLRTSHEIYAEAGPLSETELAMGSF